MDSDIMELDGSAKSYRDYIDGVVKNMIHLLMRDPESEEILKMKSLMEQSELTKNFIRGMDGSRSSMMPREGLEYINGVLKMTPYQVLQMLAYRSMIQIEKVQMEPDHLARYMKMKPEHDRHQTEIMVNVLGESLASKIVADVEQKGFVPREQFLRETIGTGIADYRVFLETCVRSMYPNISLLSIPSKNESYFIKAGNEPRMRSVLEKV